MKFWNVLPITNQFTLLVFMKVLENVGFSSCFQMFISLCKDVSVDSNNIFCGTASNKKVINHIRL